MLSTHMPLLVGVLTGLALLLLLVAVRSNRAMGRRVRRMLAARQAREDLTKDAPENRREHLFAALDEWLACIGLDAPEERRRLARELARGGIRQPHAVATYQMAFLCLPALGALLGYMLLAEPLGGSTGAHLIAAAAGMAAGAAAPRLWLKNRTQKRQQALERQLADALDLYVICVEAGLGLDAAMARVARELAPAAPELADELQLTAIELGFLPDRHEAFSNLLRRVPTAEFRGLVGMFQQTERYGTPLATTLRQLSAEYRAAGLLRAEEKAARLPAIMTIPMIIFVLPPLFIILIGPAILQLLALRS